MKNVYAKLCVVALATVIVITVAHSHLKSQNRKYCFEDPSFPEGALEQIEGNVALIQEYFSALQELPFSCLDNNVEVYRFLYVPQNEGPSLIRVWQEGDKKFCELKGLEHIGLPQDGAKDMRRTVSRALGENEWREILRLLDEEGYWATPVEGE